MFSHGLKPGEVIINDQLTDIFKCSPQGGMRKSNKTNTLVIVSNHVESMYDDRWVKGTLHYTGMGQTGGQSLTFMQNKTLAQSDKNGVEVYLFEVFEPQKYTFIGQVELAGDPYQEDQLDANMKKRSVWVFPLKLSKGQKKLVVSEEALRRLEEQKEKKAIKLSDEDLFERAKNSNGKVGKRNSKTRVYQRDPYVSEYVKRIAKGICRLCQEPAPFKNKEGIPYLESHHIKWLSKGGFDVIENTIALCPNCHKKMHVLGLKEDVERLHRLAQLQQAFN